VPDSIKAMIPHQNGSAAAAEPTWVSSYFLDFKKRLLNLFGFEFRQLSCSLAFQFVGEKNQHQGAAGEAHED